MIEYSWTVAEREKYCNIMCIIGTLPKITESEHK